MLLIVVPYRAGPGQEHREEHLNTFLGHMPTFMGESDHLILVVEQDGSEKFNRGSCLNAGVKWALNKKLHVDRICFHDVDLIPMPSMREAYDHSNIHLARSWKRYDTDTYLGGALTLNTEVFVSVNGYPNLFRGWGGEDDELRERLEGTVAIERFRAGEYVDLENKTLEEKLSYLRAHREMKCSDKWEVRDAYRARRKQGKSVEGLRELELRVLRETSHTTHTHIVVQV